MLPANRETALKGTIPTNLRVADLDFDVAQQMSETAKADHAVHHVETSTQAGEGQHGGVFHHGAAVDFGMMLDDAASRNQG